MSQCRRSAIVICVEQEKFTFRVQLECIAQIFRFLYRPLQNLPGARRIFLAVFHAYIAQKPRHLSLLWAPGQYIKSIKIRFQVKVCLLSSVKTLQRCHVNRTAVFHRLYKAAGRNRNIFQIAKHIRKLQTDKLYILVFHNP